MGLALAFIVARPSVAMESLPVRVVDVQSALRITIEAAVGGLLTTIPVQLDPIRLIGPPDHALIKLKELCPPGCEAVVEVNGPRLETAAFGLTKAWILRDFPAPVDPASSPPPSLPGTRHRNLLQVEVIRSGWAVMDERLSHHPQPPQCLLTAHQAGREACRRSMGTYSLPGFQSPGDNQPGQPTRPSPSDVPMSAAAEESAPATTGANGF